MSVKVDAEPFGPDGRSIAIHTSTRDGLYLLTDHLTREEAQALIAQLQAALAAGSEPKPDTLPPIRAAVYALLDREYVQTNDPAWRERVRRLSNELYRP